MRFEFLGGIIALNFLCSIGFAQNLEQNKLAVDTLFFTDKRKALNICEESLPIARELKDTFFITYFLDQAGEINRYFNHNYEAKSQLEECLLFKKNWKDLKDLSLTHNNLGKTYIQMSRYDLAAEHFITALDLMYKIDNKQGQAFYLNNLGVLFDLQKNYEKAISYYEKSQDIHYKIADTVGVGSTALNIGLSYTNLKQYDKALKSLYLAKKMHSKLPSKVRLARAINNIARVQMLTDSLDQAKRNVYEVLELAPSLDDYYLKSGIFRNSADYYIATSIIDSAFYYNNLALKLIHNSGAVKKYQELLFQRADIHQIAGNSDSAIFYLKLSHSYNDSTLTAASIQAVNEMESKYQHERNLRLLNEQALKNAEIESKIKDQRFNIYILIASILLLIVLVVLFYIRYVSKKKNFLLLEGQNQLISGQNSKLEKLNRSIEEELDKTKVTLTEKQVILELVLAEKSEEAELPKEILSLSKREMEVLCYLALGWSDEDLSKKLFISKSTVKTHLRHIYSKLLVKNRAEAVMVAHKYGLIGKYLS